MSKSQNQSTQIALIGMFTAITVLLQAMSYFVRVGTFSITLTLVPIILIGVMYGPKYSSILGAAFGIVTVVGCITAIDAGGNILFNASPILTCLLCIAKAVASALCSGLVGYKIRSKNNDTLAVILAALVAPIVNTGVFLIGMVVFFKDTLYAWAGGTDLVSYIIFGLVGVNFLIELALNVIITPIILRVTRITSKI